MMASASDVVVRDSPLTSLVGGTTVTKHVHNSSASFQPSLVLRLEGAAANMQRPPTGNRTPGGFHVGTPPGTPQMAGKDSSNSLAGRGKISTLDLAGMGNDSKPSPMLPAIGLPPTRVDTDEDLMQKGVSRACFNFQRPGSIMIGPPSRITAGFPGG